MLLSPESTPVEFDPLFEVVVGALGDGLAVADFPVGKIEKEESPEGDWTALVKFPEQIVLLAGFTHSADNPSFTQSHRVFVRSEQERDCPSSAVVQNSESQHGVLSPTG